LTINLAGKWFALTGYLAVLNLYNEPLQCGY